MLHLLEECKKRQIMASSLTGYLIMSHFAELKLKSNALELAELSEVLNTPGAEKLTKLELFDELQQEFEGPVLQEALESFCELILDQNGLGEEISETFERAFCQLSSRATLFPPPINETQPEEETKPASSSSSSKKRIFSEMTGEGVHDVLPNESSDGSAMMKNVTTSISPHMGK